MRRQYPENLDDEYEYGESIGPDANAAADPYPYPEYRTDYDEYLRQYDQNAEQAYDGGAYGAYLDTPYGQNAYDAYGQPLSYDYRDDPYGYGAYAQDAYAARPRQPYEYEPMNFEPDEYAPTAPDYAATQPELTQGYGGGDAYDYGEGAYAEEGCGETGYTGGDYAESDFDGIASAPAKKRSRGAVMTLVVGLVLMLGGAALFFYPMLEKIYNAYSMEMDANMFIGKLGDRSNYQLIDEASLPVAEVISLPAQYVDDQYVEDAADYYNPDGTVRSDVGAVSLRDKPEAYAILEIPKINLKIGMYVCDQFKQIYTHMRYGAGIYPGSAMPGTIGNCAIAAHRTGPSDFFRRLDELKAGDQMIVHMEEASYKYIVEDVWTIFPSDTSVIKPTDYAALTLTTCQAYKGVSNGKRLIVRGQLKEFASAEE